MLLLFRKCIVAGERDLSRPFIRLVFDVPDVANSDDRGWAAGRVGSGRAGPGGVET